MLVVTCNINVGKDKAGPDRAVFYRLDTIGAIRLPSVFADVFVAKGKRAMLIGKCSSGIGGMERSCVGCSANGGSANSKQPLPVSP